MKNTVKLVTWDSGLQKTEYKNKKIKPATSFSFQDPKQNIFYAFKDSI